MCAPNKRLYTVSNHGEAYAVLGHYWLSDYHSHLMRAPICSQNPWRGPYAHDLILSRCPDTSPRQTTLRTTVTERNVRTSNWLTDQTTWSGYSFWTCTWRVSVQTTCRLWPVEGRSRCTARRFKRCRIRIWRTSTARSMILPYTSYPTVMVTTKDSSSSTTVSKTPVIYMIYMI